MQESEHDGQGIDQVIKECYERNDFINAINLLEQEVLREPDNPENHLGLGTCYLQIGENAKAISKLSDAVALNPNNREAMENLAVAYRENKEYSKALAPLTALSYWDPKNIEAKYARAICHFKLGETEKALMELKRIRNIEPHNARVNKALGACYMIKIEYFNALKYLKKSMSAGLRDESNIFNIGMCYFYIGEYKSASKYFQKARSINESPQNEYMLGISLAMREKYDSAAKHISHAKFMDAGVSGLCKELPGLDRLKIHITNIKVRMMFIPEVYYGEHDPEYRPRKYVSAAQIDVKTKLN